MGTVVQAHFRTKEPGWGDFCLIETEFEDFEQFLIAVDQNRLICGSNLRTRYTEEKGERAVTGREPIAFRGEEILRARLPSWKLVQIEAA